MTTVAAGISKTAASVVAHYDRGRFADFLDLPVANGDVPKEVLALALHNAGAGPGLMLTAGLADLEDEEFISAVASVATQINAIASIAANPSA